VLQLDKFEKMWVVRLQELLFAPFSDAYKEVVALPIVLWQLQHSQPSKSKPGCHGLEDTRIG
jgi:hypothetical protein